MVPALTKLERHRGDLVAYARRLTGDSERAADLVQEGLLKAMRADAMPEDEAALVRWFCGNMRRAWIDELRGRAVREKAQAELLARAAALEAEAPEPDPCACVNDALASLSPGDQDVLRRVEVEGESATDIAAERGEQAGTVHRRVSRARDRLRDAVHETCGHCAGDGCSHCTC